MDGPSTYSLFFFSTENGAKKSMYAFKFSFFPSKMPSRLTMPSNLKAYLFGLMSSGKNE